MASKSISKAESFDVIYKAFQDINFKSFDYNTVKQSLIDYVKLYFPEAFNDFIESSEFIAHLGIFAYIAELFIYRVDINAHENFLPIAQRKDSVLKLAKFVSYNSSRNVAGRGILKIDSIQTNEPIYDARGQGLQDVPVKWNDQTNAFWKEQFIQIFNRISKQRFGTVGVNDRVQFQDVLFELYNLNNKPRELGVLPYQVNVSGINIPMELVPTQLSSDGPFERRPYGNMSTFSVMYGSDGLGDQSDLTGFFVLTKQGTLSKNRFTLDGRTPNQILKIKTPNINQTDVWVNNIDSETNQIIDDGSNIDGKSGEWVSVTLESAENIVFNTLSNPNKYEIETKDNDTINIIFGDGEFANIPSGTFDIWTRSSINDDIIIPRVAITSIPFSLYYRDERNQLFTLTFTASLISPIQNSSKSEDIERIRRNAPSVYYTQDRMVNARDYNSYPLKDPSILKLKTINRTFAGQSKYHMFNQFGGDPSDTYSNTRIFGTDLAIYFKNDVRFAYVDGNTEPTVLLTSQIEPILGQLDARLFRVINRYNETDRVIFYNSIEYITSNNQTIPNFDSTSSNKLERSAILYALGGTVILDGISYTNSNITYPVELYYDNNLSRWRTTSSSVFDSFDQPSNPTILISIDKQQTGTRQWVVQNIYTNCIAESNTTNFWSNTTHKILSYENNNVSRDTIEILSLNKNAKGDAMLTSSILMNVLGQPNNENILKDIGLPDINKLYVQTPDINNDGLPDGMLLSNLIDPQFKFESTTPYPRNTEITLPFNYIIGRDDIAILSNDHVMEGTYNITRGVTNKITVTGLNVTSIIVTKRDFVYFSRNTTDDQWVIIDNPSSMDMTLYDNNVSLTTSVGLLYKREHGKSGLNFLWRHYTTDYNLINPAVTNIHDMLILTKTYFVNVKRWLIGELVNQPSPPSPFDLRIAYNYLISNAMISDTIILKSGNIKIVFGSKAIPELQGKFKVIKAPLSILSDNEIKTQIVNAINDYFDINKWDFGRSFYFTDLSTAIHNQLGNDIETIVLSPVQIEDAYDQLLVQIVPKEDEIIIPDITVDDIEIVTSLVRTNIKQIGLV